MADHFSQQRIHRFRSSKIDKILTTILSLFVFLTVLFTATAAYAQTSDGIVIVHDLPVGGLVRDALVTTFSELGTRLVGFEDDPRGERVLFEPGDAMAVGDVNGDGRDEIVIVHDLPVGGLVRDASVTIFNELGTRLGGFEDDPRGERVLFEPGDALAVGVSGDRDGDSLLDSWEIDGIDVDGGGADYDLAALGADPDHKDIFIEVDFFDCNVAGGDCPPGDTHTHDPRANAINLIVNSFANAPVPNPDGVDGVHLFVDPDGEGLPHQMDCELDNTCFDLIKAGSFGTLAERTDPNSVNILAAKRLAFHYNLWVHNRPSMTSSGRAEMYGNDFIVSLGSWTGQIRTQNQQAGTFMHELGHNLGLRHGGKDDTNCKPNYLSIMSYSLQIQGLQPFGIFDYSTTALPTLNENQLNETEGIQDDGFITFYGPPADLDGIDQGLDGDLTDDWLVGRGIGAIDWDNDGSALELNAAADINDLEFPNCEASPNQKLEGFNDWSNIKYDFRNSRNLADAVHITDEIEELDYETNQIIEERVRSAVDRVVSEEVSGEYEYAAKLICGLQEEKDNLRLAQGLYATTINIHNPNDFDVSFLKKLALTYPPEGQTAGKVSRISVDRLKPDEALSVDCVDIKEKLYPNGFPTPYIEGFVVIQSSASLDVDAVYSTASLNEKGEIASHSSIDVEHIRERHREESKQKLPDLVSVPDSNPEVGFCRRQEGKLLVEVKNQGAGSAGQSTTEVDFGPYGKFSMATPSLAPGASTNLLFNIPSNCYGPDCPFKINVDIQSDVTETNEANNVSAGTCKG